MGRKSLGRARFASSRARPGKCLEGRHFQKNAAAFLPHPHVKEHGSRGIPHFSSNAHTSTDVDLRFHRSARWR